MSLRHPRLPLPISLTALAAALLGALLFASAAKACSHPDAEQVFAEWNDSNYYQLAPDGGLEEGANGWTLLGGAQLVNGNEDHYLNDPADSTSLRIPFGGSAISPTVCVDANTPHFRLMVRNAGDANSRLRVTAAFDQEFGVRTQNTDIRATNSWAPTDLLQFGKVKGDQERAARITFTPRDGRGDWRIDDLYVDPFARH